MSAEVVVLRLVHILSAIVWAGSLTFVTFFLAPVLGTMGPAGAPVMAGLTRRKLFTILPIVALLTILSGLRLMMIDSAGFGPGYFRSPVGRAFSIAGGLAVIAFIIGMAMTRPAMMRAIVLGPQIAAAPDEATRSRLGAELDAVRRRGTLGSQVIVVLLALAAVGMAVARYAG